MFFKGAESDISVWGVTQLPVKQVGIEIPDPTASAPDNWTASMVITVKLVASIKGLTEFKSGDYSQMLKDGQVDIWWRNVTNV